MGLSIVKPCFSMRVDEVDHRAVEVGDAHPVDHDGHAVEVGDDVTVEGALVEEQLVAQAGAAAGLHGDAQREVVATLLLEEALHLGGGDRAQVDAVGATLGGRGLDLLGHVVRSRIVWQRVLFRLNRRTRAVIPRRPRPVAPRLLSATRCGRPARRASASAPAGSANARSSPTRSTREYADSTPSARISRDPTSTWPASTTHGRSASAATARHAVGDLAGAAGEVEGALAGDHEVGGPGPVGQPDRVGDQLDPGLAGRAEQQQRVAEAAGGAGALARATAGGRRPRRTASSQRVDDRQPLLGDALLRAEGLGGAEQPGQRVVDVAGGDQLDAGDRSPRRGEVDGADAGEPGRRPGRAVDVGGGAERGEQAGAAVVGAAAAEADDDRRAPAVDGRGDQLADADVVGALGPVALGQVQPARLGALDVRRRRRRAAPCRAPARRAGRGR